MRTSRIASTHSASAVGVSRGGNPKRRPYSSVALLRKGSFARGSLSWPRSFTFTGHDPLSGKITEELHVSRPYSVLDRRLRAGQGSVSGVSGSGATGQRPCTSTFWNGYMDGATRSGYRAA